MWEVYPLALHNEKEHSLFPAAFKSDKGALKILHIWQIESDTHVKTTTPQH